jgi:hypothetical protein
MAMAGECLIDCVQAEIDLGGVAKLVEIAVAGISSRLSLSGHAARSMH